MEKITEKEVENLIVWYCKTKNIPVYGGWIRVKHTEEIVSFVLKMAKVRVDVSKIGEILDITGFPKKERE